MGLLDVEPGEICVIPRGIRYAVHLKGTSCRGYILEVFQGRRAGVERALCVQLLGVLRCTPALAARR